MLTKQEILLGQEHGVESSRVRETRRDALLAISCFMVMGLVSGLSLPNHSDSESFLVVHALFSQDGCQQEGFWEVGRHVVPPFRKLKRVSQSLPVGGGLLGPCSIQGPPMVKQLMHMVTMVPGQGGQFPSVCFPNTLTPPTLFPATEGELQRGKTEGKWAIISLLSAAVPTHSTEAPQMRSLLGLLQTPNSTKDF